MARVSVIIPTYNRAEFLPRAIASLRAQTYQDFDVVVVDDGSTDGTELVIASLRDPRIRYVRHPGRRGVSAARNTGIRASTGEWVAFLDSDDEWLPDKLERQLACAEADPSLDVIQGWHIRDEPGTRRVMRPESTNGYQGFALVLYGWRQCCVMAMIVRRSALLAAGCFDEALCYGEDWDLQYRLHEAGYRFGVVDEPLLVYYLGHEQLTGDPVHNLQGLRLYARRWGSVMRSVLGNGEYKARQRELRRHVRGMHKAHVRDLIERGDRRGAWRYSRRMLPYAWDYRRFTTRALLVALVGRAPRL